MKKRFSPVVEADTRDDALRRRFLQDLPEQRLCHEAFDEGSRRVGDGAGRAAQVAMAEDVDVKMHCRLHGLVAPSRATSVAGTCVRNSLLPRYKGVGPRFTA